MRTIKRNLQKRSLRNLYNCDQCDSIFASDPSLKRHKKEEHNKRKTDTEMNKSKKVCTEGSKGGDVENMEIDDQKNDIERALDAKIEELIPDEPEIDDILRRSLETVEEQERKKAEKFIIEKGKELALKIRELITLKGELIALKEENRNLQMGRLDLYRENEKLKAKNEEQVLINAVEQVEANNNESSDDSPVICDKCEFQAENEENLEQHKQTEHLVKCDFCGNLVDESQLQAHILTNHPGELHREENIQGNEENEIQQNEPLVMNSNSMISENVTSKCKLCNFSATQIVNLRIHMNTRHKSYKPCEYFLKNDCRNGDQCRYNHEKLNPGEFICYQCGQKFSDKSSLSNHIKTVHSDMTCKRFMSNTCKYRSENCYYKHYIPISNTNQTFLGTPFQNNPPPGPQMMNLEQRVTNAVINGLPWIIPRIMQQF